MEHDNIGRGKKKTNESEDWAEEVASTMVFEEVNRVCAMNFQWVRGYVEERERCILYLSVQSLYEEHRNRLRILYSIFD